MNGHLLLVLFALTTAGCAAGEQSPAGTRDWKWLHGLSEREAAALVAKIPDRIADGPFEPAIESLRNYRCPDWFRDAKFGIWVCYAPQAVPAKSGWYGRQMYTNLLKYHTEHFGHPSTFGFKDFIPRLTAENFDPDDLLGLFKKAGARYFVALAVHHENFDLWDSQYHRWNAVRMGPKKDMIGLWREATLKHGLRWGVTTHLARSLSWFQVAHGKDAGGAYDGNDPAYQDFYHEPFPESHHGYPKNAPATWRLEWYLRVRDLIDNYAPDLVYFDGSVPFKPDGVPGLAIIAHLYNASIKRHGGENHAVMNIKDRTSGIYDDHIATLDLERQQLLAIRDRPWQNDTSIGPWFYTEGARYKNATQVIHMLVDIVSKNGNLLLNIPMRADGTIDAEARALLEKIGRWTAVNGEAIYGTRPWITAGENTARRRRDARWHGVTGAARTNDGSFRLAAGEVRFTAKGDDTVYAVISAWPKDRTVILRTLAQHPGSTAAVTRVELLGRDGAMKTSRTKAGLAVTLPAEKPCDHAWALKITGANLRDLPVPEKPDRPEPGDPVTPDGNGTLTLGAETAVIHGPTPRVEQKATVDKPNIGYWNAHTDWVSWRVTFPEKGTYDVTVTASSAATDVPVVITVGGQSLKTTIRDTGSWDAFTPNAAGRLTISEAGTRELAFRPAAKATWKPVGLLEVRLERVR